MLGYLRRLCAILAWVLSLCTSLVGVYMLLMEGKFAVWCGDDICRFGSQRVIYTLVAFVLALLGLVIWPRPSRQPH